MKEIKVLQQNLRNYPSNLFIIPVNESNEEPGDLESINQPGRDGLKVVTAKGEEVGFIEIGEEGKVVL